MSGPLLKIYLPPIDNIVPLLSLHRMVDEGLLLRFVPHTRVTHCPRTAATREGPVVITGGTFKRNINAKYTSLAKSNIHSTFKLKLPLEDPIMLPPFSLLLVAVNT